MFAPMDVGVPKDAKYSNSRSSTSLQRRLCLLAASRLAGDGGGGAGGDGSRSGRGGRGTTGMLRSYAARFLDTPNDWAIPEHVLNAILLASATQSARPAALEAPSGAPTIADCAEVSGQNARLASGGDDLQSASRAVHPLPCRSPMASAKGALPAPLCPIS